MKKLVACILLLCILSALAACASPEASAPKETEKQTAETAAPSITPQEVYDAGKSLAALLGDHENVSVRITSNGTLVREEYLSKSCSYSFTGTEYMDMGFDYAGFVTDRAEYVCFEGEYSFNVTLTPEGMLDAKERFAAAGTVPFLSTEVLNSPYSIAEKDGFLIVTCNADPNKVAAQRDDVVSCVETYTLDAKTREMTAIQTVYTYKDNTVDEGVITITRDTQTPESIKPFLAYEQKTEDMHTVTVVSHPDTENETAETVRIPHGLRLGLSPEWSVEKTFTMYTDAACTQAIEEGPIVNSDLSIYVKWSE